MDKKRLDEIRFGELHATEGTWFSMEDDSCWTMFAKQEGQDVELARCPKGGTQFAEHWPNLVDSMFMTNARQDIPDLLAYVEELEEIEQIYKRSEDNYNIRIAELLDRVQQLEAGCKIAMKEIAPLYKDDSRHYKAWEILQETLDDDNA